MNTKALATRLVSVFVSTAIPNIGVGAVVDVDIWKASVMSGAIAVLAVVQKLAAAYKDGKLTEAEVSDAFGDS